MQIKHRHDTFHGLLLRPHRLEQGACCLMGNSQEVGMNLGILPGQPSGILYGLFDAMVDPASSSTPWPQQSRQDSVGAVSISIVVLVWVVPLPGCSLHPL